MATIDFELARPDLFRSNAYINGVWHTTGKTYPVKDPATGQVIADVVACAGEETDVAIAAAEQAWKKWRGTTASAKHRVLLRWHNAMIEHQDDLARIMVLEQGKPFAEARGEVVYAASFLEWFAEESKRVYGDVIPAHRKDARIVVLKQPIGVVGAITPWNFPLAMITRKVAPAIAAGCTVVVKPSEETPLSANALAVLAEEAGIPPGVFNVVSGNAPAIGEALMASTAVRKISFTGSTRTGKLLMKQAAETVKNISLELGGNAPFIVFDDANIDEAVDGAIASKFRNTGQTCVCVNRFFVQEGVYREFTEKLGNAVTALHVGQGFEDGVRQGPLINDAAFAKVEAHLKDAQNKGATVLVGGKKYEREGNFYCPTVLGDATPDMLLAQEETFGPVAACFRFRDEAEAIALANDTEYGLAAYFYTQDYARAWRVAAALESGMVGINEGIISTAAAPFGGVKQSGIGREGSKYGIDDYVDVKYVLMGGLK